MKPSLAFLLLAAAPFAASAADPAGKPAMKHGGGHLLERADTDGDGRVSRDEAQAAASARTLEMFDRLDQDKDGYVTQAEIAAAREERVGEMRERMESHFRNADTDGDGAISKAEAEAGMPALARRFDAIDANKDGLITREEMKAMGPPHGGPRTHRSAVKPTQ
jgi:hypothetical protein